MTDQPPPDVDVYTGRPAPGTLSPFDVRRQPRFDHVERVGRTDPPPHVKIWLHLQGVWHDVTCDGLGQLRIDGGRGDKMNEVDATTMTLTLRWDNPGVDLPHIGDWITVGTTDSLPYGSTTYTVRPTGLFKGRITDLAFEDPYLSLVAADPLADLRDVVERSPSRPSESIVNRLEQYLLPKMKAGNPDYDWLPSTTPHVTPFVANVVKVPDWEDLDVWEAIKRICTYTGSAIFYCPGDPGTPRGESPDDDPEKWGSQGIFVTGLPTDQDELRSLFRLEPHLACEVISSDPTPRQYQNRAAHATVWRLYYHAADPTKDDPDPKMRYTSLAPKAWITKYGSRVGTLETNLLGPGSMQLAREWLARSQTPLWCLDNVTVLLTGPIQRIVSSSSFKDAWNVMAYGAGQVGRPVLVELVQGQGFSFKVIEGTSIEWRPDGWQVTLAMSHMGLYDARFAVGGNPDQAPPDTTPGRLNGQWRYTRSSLSDGDLYVNALESDAGEPNVWFAYHDATGTDQTAALRAVQPGDVVTIADTQSSWMKTGRVQTIDDRPDQSVLGVHIVEMRGQTPPLHHILAVTIREGSP